MSNASGGLPSCAECSRENGRKMRECRKTALLRSSIRLPGPLCLFFLPVLVSSAALALSPPRPSIEYIASTVTSHSPSLLDHHLLTSLSVCDDSTTSTAPNKLDVRAINKLEYDEVIRILDPNTVKLKRNGLVSFAAVQVPSGYKSNFQFPECMSKSPSSKSRQLLPAGSKVGVRIVDNKSAGSRPRAALIVTKDGTLVNSELVRSGFARPVSRGRGAVELILPGLGQELASLQHEAQDKRVGMYMNCESQSETIIPSDGQFEPLEYTLETEWTEDGGKPVLQQRDAQVKRPRDPGDTKGCSDFDFFEDSLRWYETYAPWYGDVAKLDPDDDGVPCPGLPHTKDQSRYRMKVPSSRQSF